MAVLGAQLVFSLVIFSFLQKLSCIYSFGRWLLAGRLVRYLHPSDEDLRTAAGILPPGANKGKSKRHDNKKGTNNKENKDESFTIPRSTPFTLDVAEVKALDLIHIRYFGEYLWLLDFSVCALMVYILTEVYYTLGNWNEMNVSILWCLLAVGFCVRILLSQTGMYFTSDEGGERILVVTFGFFFLVMGMGVLVINDETLEFGLEKGYNNFSDGATLLLTSQGIESAGPVSLLTFKIILAVFCAIIGALLTFPGLRMARLHLDALKYCRDSPLRQVILHTNFMLPYIILLLWVKPIGRDMICGLNWKVTNRVFTEQVFDNFRIVLFLVLALIRLLLLPTHLQSHLNSAYTKVESIRKESGRISNIEIQKMVARVFYFTGVVVLQYLTPVIVLFFMACLYKTLGEYSWSGTFGEVAERYVDSLKRSQPAVNVTVSGNGTESSSESVVEKAMQYSLAFSNLRAVFTPVFYRGILSFLTWWVCATWTVAMSFGIYYHSRAES